MGNEKRISSKDCDTRDELFTNFVENDFALIPLRGKEAYTKRWSHLKPNPLLLPSDIEGNYGVVLKDTDLVLDVDPRNFPKGKNVLMELQRDFPVITRLLENTFTVRTGGGGYHYYFTKPKNFKPVGRHPDYPGIEFKSKGCQVVGPGSVHPESGKLYEYKYGDLGARKEFPLEIASKFERSNFFKAVGLDGIRDTPGTIGRFREYLKTAPIAIEGQEGDKTTFKVAAKGKDFGLSPEMTFELMLDCWNEQCEPPWGFEELKRKVDNAYLYGQQAPGADHAETDFEKYTKGPRTAKTDEELAEELGKVVWDKDPTRRCAKTGILLPRFNSVANVVTYMRIPNYESYTNALYKLIRFNTLSNQIEFTRPAPWHNDHDLRTIWIDDDDVLFKYYLATVRNYKAALNVVREGSLIVARMAQYHPIRKYLTALKWDGTPRIDTFFSVYTGSKDNEYTRAVAKIMFIGSVARVIHPGCQFDTIVVLEGKQGTGKSSLIKILGGEYSADIVIDTRNKDTVDAIRGKWWVELSELECAKRIDAQALKAFISRSKDTFRVPYGRVTQDFPRQCIFIGTINPEANGYLTDVTGNRRFLPIHTTKINLGILKRDRDQLFAEAFHRFQRGELFHIEDKQILKTVEYEQLKRLYKDPWIDALDDYIHSKEPPDDGVYGTNELGVEALNLTTSRIGRPEAARIANCMSQLGYEHGKFYSSDKKRTINGFRREDIDYDLLKGL